MRRRSVSCVVAVTFLVATEVSAYPTCSGDVDVIIGDSSTTFSVTRNNHSSPGSDPYYSGPVEVYDNNMVPEMTDVMSASGARTSGRAYLSTTCDEGTYDNTRYSAFNLLDQTISYSVNLSAATCGCNAAFYLVSMAQNSDASECDDYYCDANSVCGVACTEIDIQEANTGSWLTTAHTSSDPSGAAVGYGGGGAAWSGPRDFTSTDYAPSPDATINTLLPFQVSASFPTSNGVLSSIDMKLEQDDQVLSFSLTSYHTNSGVDGFVELTSALTLGMTPVVSYWSSYDMQWLDGTGSDGQGACPEDVPASCGERTFFGDISISAYAP